MSIICIASNTNHFLSTLQFIFWASCKLCCFVCLKQCHGNTTILLYAKFFHLSSEVPGAVFICAVFITLRNDLELTAFMRMKQDILFQCRTRAIFCNAKGLDILQMVFQVVLILVRLKIQCISVSSGLPVIAKDARKM